MFPNWMKFSLDAALLGYDCADRDDLAPAEARARRQGCRDRGAAYGGGEGVAFAEAATALPRRLDK